MVREPAPLTDPQDLPRVEKRPDGLSDHAYVELYRDRGPVAVDRYGFFWTCSHAHLLTCTDPSLTRQVETEKVVALGIKDGPVYDYFANSLLFSNGDTHQRRRRPLARAFAHKLMAGMRPRIREVAESLIGENLRAPDTDFLGAIAGPLPARIVAEILGAPERDIPHFSALVHSAMRALSLRPAEISDNAVSALAELDAYVTALLVDRRCRPVGDFLSEYVTDVGASDLTENEARTQITSVILAGSDTTRMALASTFSQLLQHREQWTAFVRNPDGLKADVVAEGLRYDPVIGSLPRVAVCDLALDHVRVPEGTVLAPIVLAVLRDPAVYAEPDRFDIHRRDHPRYHPVFGAGAHRCLGEALARAELEETLAVLARLAPNAQLSGPPPTLRGISGARTIDAMYVHLK